MISSLSPASLLFKAILVALLLVCMLSWASIKAAVRLNLIDFPGSAPHKQHIRPTPLAGGLALFAAVILLSWMFGTLQDTGIRATLVGAGIVFIFGLWDDLKNISPPLKLAGQVLAAVVMIYLGISVRIFESPEFFIRGSEFVNVWLDWLVTVLWIVGITNAFNFVDSMDGLAVGLGAMAAAFFMFVTIDSHQPVLSLHSALLVGACIGLYLLNSQPAILFLGDSGAQTLGFILAVLAIDYRPVGANQSSSWIVPILLLFVPMFDSSLVVFSRLRRKRPIYSASRDHTYHRLLGLGINPLRAVLSMHAAALLLGCLAFVVLPEPPLIANVVFFSIVILSVIALVFLDSRKRWL